MADYYPLIARAISGLDPSAPGEQRRALYERARSALIAQLRSVQPPNRKRITAAAGMITRSLRFMFRLDHRQQRLPFFESADHDALLRVARAELHVDELPVREPRARRGVRADRWMSATVLPVVKRGLEPEFDADGEPDWPWRFAPEACWRSERTSPSRPSR